MERMPQDLSLRDLVLRRPGMYFGTADAHADALAVLLGDWALALLGAGAAEVAIVFRANGRVEFAHVGGEPIEYMTNIVVACSSTSELESSVGGSRLHFQPDVALFPMLAVRGARRLIGMLRDAATAFPSATVSLLDETSGIELRARYPRGSVDRLTEEAAGRTLNRVVRLAGANDVVRFDLAFAWCNGPGLQVVAITNGERNANGGSHVQGVWDGIADALGEHGVRCEPQSLPRNAALVVSVHLESPIFGPATKDCLHDRRAREALRDAIAREFFSQLGEAGVGPTPPWQTLAGLHRQDGPWLTRASEELAGGLEIDPYAHHEDHCSSSAEES